MNFNQKVSNPMLVGAISLLKAEDTPEHRIVMEDEIYKATFLAPVQIDPEPQKTEAGGILVKAGSKIQIPALIAPNGARFYMAFTDRTEYLKAEQKEGYYEAAFTYGDYMKLLFQNDPQNNYAGFVINPYGGNIILPKEIVLAIHMRQTQGMRDS